LWLNVVVLGTSTEGSRTRPECACPLKGPKPHLLSRGPSMSDQRAFLQALLAAPTDDVSRLVYADWLQERKRSAVRVPATGLPNSPTRVLLRRAVCTAGSKNSVARSIPIGVALVRRQQVSDSVETALNRTGGHARRAQLRRFPRRPPRSSSARRHGPAVHRRGTRSESGRCWCPTGDS